MDFGACSDTTAVVSLPDLPWMLLRGHRSDGGDCWVLAEVVLGEAIGHELDVCAPPTPDELRRAMLRLCGRPIADTLIDEAVRVLPDIAAPVR